MKFSLELAIARGSDKVGRSHGRLAREEEPIAIAGPLARWLRVTAISVALSLTAGCTLLNPYVDFSKYKRTELETGASVDLATGVNYATQTKQAYRDALGDRAEFRNLLGIGLIPLTAATLALGIDGASSTAVLITGMTGVTAYGVGTWLDSKPTERAYIAGSNAISCALDAVEPLRIASSDKDFASFEAGLNAIDTNIENVEKAIGRVQGLVSTLPATESAIIGLSNEDIESARTVISNAIEVRRNGVSLRREINRTGNRLVGAVDRITGEVDMAVLQSQPDLQALASIVNGLGQAYGQFSAVPESLKSGKDIKAAEAAGVEQADRSATDPVRANLELLKNALTELQNKVVVLSTSSRQIADFVNAVAEMKPSEALKRCGVDPEQFAGDISVEPQGPVEFTVGQRESAGRVIIGGRAPYRASLIGSAPGITVVQPELFGPTFAVQAGDGTAVGKYSILVADGSGHRKTIEVVVKAANEGDGKQPGQGGGNESTTSLSEEGLKLPPDDVRTVQRAICTPEGEVDGVWGQKTDDLFVSYKQRAGTSKTDAQHIEDLKNLTPEQVAEICKTGAQEAETQPTRPQIERFAAALEGTSIDVGEEGAPISFKVEGKPKLADDGKSAIIQLTYLAGGPPPTTIAIDIVKRALRNAAAEAGQPMTDAQVTIADEEDIKRFLQKQ